MLGGWLEAPVLPRDPDDRWAVIKQRSSTRLLGKGWEGAALEVPNEQ